MARALGNNDGGREELFYQAPGSDDRDYGYNNTGGDMEALIGSSESMLQESLALTMDSERIGNSTLEQMGRQRDQLQGARGNIGRIREIAEQSSLVMKEISRRALKNKMFLYVLVGLLIILNFWALTRLFNKHE